MGNETINPTIENTQREAIRAFIQERLTASIKETDSIEFVAVKDIAKANDNTVEVRTIEGTYATYDQKLTYVTVYDYFGKPQPIVGIKVISYSIRLDFLCHTNDKNLFNQEKNAMEVFIDGLRGQSFDDDAKNYHWITSASQYTNTGRITEIEEEEYVMYSMFVYITTTDDAYASNGVTYGIRKYKETTPDAYVAIPVITPKIIMGTDTYDTSFITSTYKTTSQVKIQKAKGITLQLGIYYYKDIAIVKDIINVIVNKLFTLFDIKITIPTDDEENPIILEETFFINASTINLTPGNIIMISLVLDEPEKKYVI